MVTSPTRKDKENDIATYFVDLISDGELGDKRYSYYRKLAVDFIRYMAARGWDIVDYDQDRHRYHHNMSKKRQPSQPF